MDGRHQVPDPHRPDLERYPVGNDLALGQFGLSQLVVAQNHSRPHGATERTVFGPFHVEGAPRLPTHGGNIAIGYSNAELTAVANYVVAHFGGKTGRVTPEDIAARRPLSQVSGPRP